MRTYEQILADATDRPPFSNGTAGYAWMDNWCHRPCKKDRNEDCPLIMAALMQKTPKEWTEVPGRIQDYVCSEFEPDDEGDGEAEPQPYPQPVGEIDGQVDLFAVFADQIADRQQQLVGAGTVAA